MKTKYAILILVEIGIKIISRNSLYIGITFTGTRSFIIQNSAIVFHAQHLNSKIVTIVFKTNLLDKAEVGRGKMMHSDHYK